MLIYLLRHGDANSKSDIPDEDRTLTNIGIQQATSIGKYLQQNNATIETILSSPILRAKQTAAIIQNYIANKDIVLTDFLLNGANLSSMLQYVENLNRESLLLVGHIPHLEDTITLLTDRENKIKMKKCDLVIIDIAKPITQNRGKILEIIHPNNLLSKNNK